MDRRSPERGCLAEELEERLAGADRIADELTAVRWANQSLVQSNQDPGRIVLRSSIGEIRESAAPPQIEPCEVLRPRHKDIVGSHEPFTSSAVHGGPSVRPWASRETGCGSGRDNWRESSRGRVSSRVPMNGTSKRPSTAPAVERSGALVKARNADSGAVFPSTGAGTRALFCTLARLT